jgi:spermidine/putrescine transport system substrate-binding protein
VNNKRALAWMLAIVAILVSGCGKSAESAKPTTAASADASSKTLHIYIWTEYLPPSVIDQFTKRTGINVTVDNYASNEELIAKLASGVSSYDLCVPSDYVVQPLIAQKLLHPLDHTRLPNIKNLAARFLDQAFDPGNQYTLPYLWGTTGIGYNKKLVNPAPDSWDALFNPAYKGKILMLDDKRRMLRRRTQKTRQKRQ